MNEQLRSNSNSTLSGGKDPLKGQKSIGEFFLLNKNTNKFNKGKKKQFLPCEDIGKYFVKKPKIEFNTREDHIEKVKNILKNVNLLNCYLNYNPTIYVETVLEGNCTEIDFREVIDKLLQTYLESELKDLMVVIEKNIQPALLEHSERFVDTIENLLSQNTFFNSRTRLAVVKILSYFCLKNKASVRIKGIFTVLLLESPVYFHIEEDKQTVDTVCAVIDILISLPDPSTVPFTFINFVKDDSIANTVKNKAFDVFVCSQLTRLLLFLRGSLGLKVYLPRKDIFSSFTVDSLFRYSTEE